MGMGMEVGGGPEVGRVGTLGGGGGERERHSRPEGT